jgi:hypothetical protein
VDDTFYQEKLALNIKVDAQEIPGIASRSMFEGMNFRKRKKEPSTGLTVARLRRVHKH